MPASALIALPAVAGVVPVHAGSCVCVCVHAQTGAGKLAKSPTWEEIKDIVKAMLARVASMTCAAGERPTADKPFPHGFTPNISLDNAACHNKAKAEMRADPTVHATFDDIPPYSPDIHKCIEHVHAVLHQAFVETLTHTKADALPDTVPELFQLVQRLFQTRITVRMVQADILSLQRTLAAIVDGNGAYPVKALR